MANSLVSNLNRTELFAKLDEAVAKLKAIDARFKRKNNTADDINACKIMRDTHYTIIGLIRREHKGVFRAWKRERANKKPSVSNVGTHKVEITVETPDRLESGSYTARIAQVEVVNGKVRVKLNQVEPKPINRIYWTLLIKENGIWSPQFGDWDKTVVRQERFDSYPDDVAMIIGTKPEQEAIDLYVHNLNNGIPNE